MSVGIMGSFSLIRRRRALVFVLCLAYAPTLGLAACATPACVLRVAVTPAQLLSRHARLAPLAVAAAGYSGLLNQPAPLDATAPVYAAAIAACADSGEWRGACALLSEMDSRGLPIAYRPLTSALRATANAGEWGATMRLHGMANARRVPMTRAGCALSPRGGTGRRSPRARTPKTGSTTHPCA